jgi:hypothetical protein
VRGGAAAERGVVSEWAVRGVQAGGEEGFAMKVYVVMEGTRHGWESFDKPISDWRMVGIYSNETSARTHVEGLHPRFGRAVRIDEFEVDQPFPEMETP